MVVIFVRFMMTMTMMYVINLQLMMTVTAKTNLMTMNYMVNMMNISNEYN